MIAILDYNTGNIKSIWNMFNKLGIESIITANVDEIEKASKYVLPGVGSFDHGIHSLKCSSFFNALETEVLGNKKPVLGICLGMQLLTNSSEEGKQKGLGWINAETVRFDLKDYRLAIPHMGWNYVNPVNSGNIFRNLEVSRFYFVHSYHVLCNYRENILATADYGGEFVCSIVKDNIYGVQFHPEKSHKFGMQLLQNFGEI